MVETKDKKSKEKTKSKVKKYKKTKLKYFNFYKELGCYKLSIAIYSIVMVAMSYIQVFSSLIFANCLYQFTQSNFDAAIKSLAILCAIYLVSPILKYISSVIYWKLRKNFYLKTINKAINQSFIIDTKSYADATSSEIVRKVLTEPSNVFNGFSKIVFIISQIASQVSLVVYLAFINIYIALVIIVIIVASYFIESFRIKKREILNRELNKEYDESYSFAYEMINGNRDVKTLNLEKRLSKKLHNKFTHIQEKCYKTEILLQIISSSGTLFLNLGSLGLLILGIYLAKFEIITVSMLTIVYTNKNSVNNLIMYFNRLRRELSYIRISSERIDSLYDPNFYTTERYGNMRVCDVQGNIKVENISFAYVDYEKDKNKENDYYNSKNPYQPPKIKSVKKVFENLSLEIKKNTSVAFVGESGCGKSTLLSLISKVHTVENGQILIDDIDINNFDKDSLRNTFSFVTQSPYIFDMSIKENLLLAKFDASDEEINLAIKKASLLEFVEQLPDGVETIVGESGVKLSGGQRQRLAIARAFLKESKIIILDESTSSLDNFAQNNIKDSLNALQGRGTIIIVAHRLSTIKDVDLIYFMENGKITDQGTFEYLLANNKQFQKLFMAENCRLKK